MNNSKEKKRETVPPHFLLKGIVIAVLYAIIAWVLYEFEVTRTEDTRYMLAILAAAGTWNLLGLLVNYPNIAKGWHIFGSIIYFIGLLGLSIFAVVMCFSMQSGHANDDSVSYFATFVAFSVPIMAFISFFSIMALGEKEEYRSYIPLVMLLLPYIAAPAGVIAFVVAKINDSSYVGTGSQVISADDGEGLYNRGKEEFDSGNYSKAKETFYSAYSALQRSGDSNNSSKAWNNINKCTKMEAKSLFDQGNFCYDTHNYYKAGQYYRDASVKFREALCYDLASKTEKLAEECESKKYNFM